jgi:hypothetical protein
MEMPSPSWDSLIRESRILARRRRRRRRQRLMLWLLTAVTTAVLVVIALMVRQMAKAPTAAVSAALSTSVHATGSDRTPASSLAKPSPQLSGQGRQVTDSASGLSYRLLPAPWHRGCPSALDTPMLSWSAGERAVAGFVTIGGSTVHWHGLACSGQLQQQFQYSGPADLAPTAMSLVGAFDQAYYAGLQHVRTIEGSSALAVSGHQAWMVTFLMTYPDAAGQGLAWSSEAGAVVAVDRGPGQAPAIFYVSVPSNLGVSTVSLLVSSLRLS